MGLRRLVLSDGPAGVRGEHWDERDTSTSVPSPTALAATWDELLVHELGRLLAYEARRKHVDVLLAPAVNLHRTPYAGRHFECFSEDPLLTARIAVAYVRGVQSGGVAATVKHFVANDSETERMTLDARIDERALFEMYLAPFEAVVREASVWAVMAAYNSVNGHSMTESPLLEEVLRRRWGFDGVVMSDWFATRSTAASARAAMDLVMPGPEVRGETPWCKRCAPERSTKRRSTTRCCGSCAWPVGSERCKASRVAPRLDRRRRGRLGRSPCRRGRLHGRARNQRGVLPLERSRLRRVAVIGPNAASARTLGGGSATVFAPYSVSPLDGLLAALPATVEVRHCIGVTASNRIPVGGPPWMFRPDGEVPGSRRTARRRGAELLSERRPGCAFHWPVMSAINPSQAPRSALRFAPPTRAPTRWGSPASGITACRSTPRGARRSARAPAGSRHGGDADGPSQAAHEIELHRGEQVKLVAVSEIGPTPALGIRFSINVAPLTAPTTRRLFGPYRSRGRRTWRWSWSAPPRRSRARASTATRLRSRAARTSWSAGSLTQTRDTIVVVNAGAPVLLPWADRVAAVLLAWFPGQEFGNALADVLFGDAEPGGRLPTTWPARGGPADDKARRRRPAIRRGPAGRLSRPTKRRPCTVRTRSATGLAIRAGRISRSARRRCAAGKRRGRGDGAQHRRAPRP